MVYRFGVMYAAFAYITVFIKMFSSAGGAGNKKPGSLQDRAALYKTLFILHTGSVWLMFDKAIGLHIRFLYPRRTYAITIRSYRFDVFNLILHFICF